MSYIQFESSRVKEAARQEIRDAREMILEKAKLDYHRRQAKKEKAKQTGDDRWLLPSVESKLKSDKKSKKKRKKEKKEKKSKKKKKKHSKSSTSSDSSDSEEGEEWVEKVVEPQQSTSSSTSVSKPEKALERDEWMNLPGLFPCVTRDDTKKSAEKVKKDVESSILAKPGCSNRELNPYWKNGGTGLPENETRKASGEKVMDAVWLRKSLQRAYEQAEEEGKSIDEIAADRWGSLDKIKSMIAEAESKSRNSLNPKYGRNRLNTDKEGYKSYTHQKREISIPGTHSTHHELHPSPEYKDNDSRSNKRDRRKWRSRSRSRSPRRSDKYDKREKEYNIRRRKMAFEKPNGDTDFSTANSSRPSSSRVKNWQKPEAKKKLLEHQSESVMAKSESVESCSDTDSEPEKVVKNEEERILTEAEMNQLGARIVKAEIMGDDDLAAELKMKLEEARKIRENAPVSQKKKAEVEAVILTRTDARGITRPVEPKSQYEEPRQGRRKAKNVETHASGQRVRYFADDDKYTLKEMFQQEVGRSTSQDDAMFVKTASKSMDMDEMFEQHVRREESDAKQDARNRMQAIKEHEKISRSLDNCRLCVDSKQMLKHMIVSLGTKVYLSLPSYASLTTGHCILAPIHHITCQTQLDEDIWEEMQTYKKTLAKMFADRNESVVFFEVFVGRHKFPHLQLECVPMPKEIGEMAPIYFKKAILECETEWSTNKKVVDLSQKNVRRAIPKGLPYFAVNFDTQGGFAHVIENERLFPKNFAQEIIGGMLDLDHNLWRKPRRENFDQQRSKVMEFAEMWKKYDFTIDND